MKRSRDEDEEKEYPTIKKIQVGTDQSFEREMIEKIKNDQNRIVVFTAKDYRKIEQLYKWYDARYIINFDPDQINYLLSVSNQVINKLINNLKINPRTYLTHFIEGPITFYNIFIKHNQRKMNFMLFGEIHRDTTGDCDDFPDSKINFTDFLIKISNKTQGFLDVFIEEPYIEKSKEESYAILDSMPYRHKIKDTLKRLIKNKDSSLFQDPNFNFFSEFNQTPDRKFKGESSMFGSIRDNFLDCIQPSTRRLYDKCNLMRIHNVDIRSSYNPKSYDNFFIFELLSTILSLDNFTFKTKIFLLRKINDCKVLLESLIKGDCLSFDNFWAIVGQNHIFKKEYKRSTMKSQIRVFFQTKFKELITKSGERNIIKQIKEIISFIYVPVHLKNVKQIKNISRVLGIDISNILLPTDDNTTKTRKILNAIDTKLSKGINTLYKTLNYMEIDPNERLDIIKPVISDSHIPWPPPLKFQDDLQPELYDVRPPILLETNQNNTLYPISKSIDPPQDESSTILIEMFFMELFALVVDIYLLSRMFKKYRKSHSFQPLESNNFILYAGQKHTLNIALFLLGQDEFGRSYCVGDKDFRSYDAIEEDVSCVQFFPNIID
jgi:hypothetical protein